MDGTKIVVANIKRIVREKGLKHKYMAEKLEITPNMFSYMMYGRKIITIDHIFAIAKALDVPISELFETGEERSRE